MKITKNRKILLNNFDAGKVYEPLEAIKILKEKSFVKFNETIDISINLGIDTNKTDQNIKGVINLPKGSGKTVKVAVIANQDKLDEARSNGADIVGSEDLIETISKSKIDFDILIATPDMMPKLGKVAKILGPKGLMPNPKLGTVATDIKKAVQEIKTGLVEIKNDKDGNVASTIGRKSFTNDKLINNFSFLIDSIKKEKPETMKGELIKNIYITSSMGISYKVGGKI